MPARIFNDRIEASEALVARLQEYRGRNPLILAIPRGAVPMGKVIAERLDGELDIVLVHKLGTPFDPSSPSAPSTKRAGPTFLPNSKTTAAS